jgi:hypothetical protein
MGVGVGVGVEVGRGVGVLVGVEVGRGVAVGPRKGTEEFRLQAKAARASASRGSRMRGFMAVTIIEGKEDVNARTPMVAAFLKSGARHLHPDRVTKQGKTSRQKY